ncbi:MAG TPA: bifunctional diaminohydroxyphosphoribosylaminopyrimidine deaminase/5-amino-6-(5-phosphoribosylamino)uracil reductase RibD [Ohtaekwangia sp.]|nr:bifunctional diaminohydroxyphosphoribosylaminopyrimidine deaminase/5-amino-6-(5-phosphoribosylamino)uracil reductase RibD [Ohtaekwangia sp.]
MNKSDHKQDELYMQRAIELAALGRGYVSPNPLVGSVVVYNDTIIGEGWHKKWGDAHAEVNAIRSVKDKMLLPHATVYVTLEPCSHFGKTPPCTDLLIEHKVKKVVVATLDTNPLVAGEGIKKLRAAGIEVITGILDKVGRELNKRFFTFMEKQRPYIILKWAETSDGFIAQENYDSKWISNALSRQWVHKWRSEEDAILIGTKTVVHDNPQLNVRDWTGRNPTRVIIDRFLKLNEKLHVFDRSQPTLCYNLLKHEEFPNLSLVRIDENNFLQNVLHDLWKRKIQSLVIEGGATLLRLFIEAGLWDEARVFQSPRMFNKGIAAPDLKGKLQQRKRIEDDWLSIHVPH